MIINSTRFRCTIITDCTGSSTAVVMHFPDQNRSRNSARWCRCCHRANRFRNGGRLISESELSPSASKNSSRQFPPPFCDRSTTWTATSKCRHQPQAAATACWFRHGFTKARLPSRMPRRARSRICTRAAKLGRVSQRMLAVIASHNRFIRDVPAVTATLCS